VVHRALGKLLLSSDILNENSSNILEENYMKGKKLSPFLAAAIAAGVVFLIAVCLFAAVVLSVPNPATVDITKMNQSQLQTQSQMYKNAANIGQAVETLTCPAAIIAAVVAYYWAKGKKKSTT
jgi:hypothetical protein